MCATSSRASIEELNRAAETYSTIIMASELPKPFAKPDEVPPLLMDAANMLQGLRLAPGAHVLDFGAGSGWLSRWLTQLGCRVTLLDVSPTALAMARELYSRQPIIGDRPPPAFLPFDGRHRARRVAASRHLLPRVPSRAQSGRHHP
jgi:2-polyprenyl-3-methyl-5-hydroxy-6-metoxy-1,4-benzoquinol methylase